MGIRIVNLRTYVKRDNEVLCKCDRSMPLGNPYYMSSEAQRDKVCDEYYGYFHNIIRSSQNSAQPLSAKEERFMGYLRNIFWYMKQGNDVALGCWCYPKRCHCETIKEFLEAFDV